LHHTHEDTDCLCRANQSLDRIRCVFKVNTSGLEKLMQLTVVNAAQWRSDPHQMPATAHMVAFHT